jgi:hypothetical protein
VAIWASIHWLSALMLSGQLGAVLKKPARAARLEQTVIGLEHLCAARLIKGDQLRDRLPDRGFRASRGWFASRYLPPYARAHYARA